MWPSRLSWNDVLKAPERLRSLNIQPLEYYAESFPRGRRNWVDAGGGGLFSATRTKICWSIWLILPEVPRPDVGVVKWSEWKATERR